MPRTSQRFPQIGGEGEQYHVHSKAGEPRYHASGAPKMAWSFPYADLSTRSSRLAGASNFAHSIETAPHSAVEEGKLWYPKVNEAVRKGVSKRGFLSASSDKLLSGAGIVAAVSPNMDWDNANIHAFKEIQSLKGHQWHAIMSANLTDNHAAARLSRMEARDQLQGMSLSRQPLKNIQKVGHLLAGADPDDIIGRVGAPKTNSFMHNIAHPSDPNFATIDGRAMDTITNRARPWETGRGIGRAMNKGGGMTRYEHAEDIVKHVAGHFGLDPSEAQAISWVNTKYHIEQAGNRKQGPARTGQPYFDPHTGHPTLLKWGS